MALIPCPECGAQISDKAASCPKCGIARQLAAHAPEPAQKVFVTGASAQDVDRAIAMSKSFVGSAFLVWLLYYVGCYIIGLVLNVMYMSEASAIKKRTGVSPSGSGCLTLLLLFHLIVPVLLLVMYVLFWGAVASR